jgi:hypothetical protein
MRMSKVHAALLLVGMATGFGIQAGPLQSAAGDGAGDRIQAGRGRVQLAQAGGNQQKTQSPGQGGPEHHGPPPAAIAACKGLASGAGCSFVGRENQSLSGTCFSPRTDRPLACRPPRGARGAKGGPGGNKG